MSQSKWAAIVYSRTYEVDFRLIVVPKDFTNQDKQWAEKYILGTTRLPEKLLNQPRWSLLKNEHYCVIGVTCMLSAIMANFDNEDTSAMMLDKGKRPVYGFFGYVTQLTKDCDAEIPAMNLELFAQLHKYLSERWYVQSFEPASKIPDESQYEVDFKATDIDRIEDKYLRLNYSDKRINLYPNSDAKALWVEASQCRHPVSLCLGIAREKDAIDGPFLNATALDVVEVCTKAKQNEPRVNTSNSEDNRRLHQTDFSPNQPTQNYERRKNYPNNDYEKNSVNDDWGDDDWDEKNFSQTRQQDRDKVQEFFNNFGEFILGEVEELRQIFIPNPDNNSLDNSSNYEQTNPDNRLRNHQEQNKKLKKNKRNPKSSTSPQLRGRKRSSKQQDQITDTSFGFVEKQDSKEDKPQPDKHSTESANTDNDWFK